MRPKTLKYTRQQIEEAIRFWTRILENKSPFLDRLVTEFGYDAVFGKDSKMQFDLSDIERIACIANDIIFEHSFSCLRILRDEKHMFTSNDVPLGYSYVTYDDEETGKCTLLTQPVLDSKGVVLYDSPAIYVVPELLSHSALNLITISSIVVHEMIHQHIIENADSEELNKIRENISINLGHNSKFMKMMTSINEQFGLNVSIQGSSSYDDDSYDRLLKFAGDDYLLPENEKQMKFASIRRHESGFTEIVLH